MLGWWYISIKLSDFIAVYDAVLPAHLCDSIVTAFDNSQHLHEMSVVGEGDIAYDYRQAIEMNCSIASDTSAEWKNITTSLNNLTLAMFSRYRRDMEALGVYDIPDTRILEEWRMHRYDKDIHFYKKHVDSHDCNSSNRMIACLFYPNTVEEGGETAFTDHLEGISCNPIKGRLLMFPTWFGYPHQALPVISGTKYMIKTFLHYPGELENVY